MNQSYNYSPLPEAAARIAEHPRAVYRSVWIGAGALLLDHSGRVEGVCSERWLNGGGVRDVICSGGFVVSHRTH